MITKNDRANSLFMKEEEPLASAWQPFTFGGVGLFSQSQGSSIFGMMFGFAVVLGVLIGWIFFARYLPRLDQAISKLPNDGAAILDGRLLWPGASLATLTEGPFLGIAVDPVSAGDPIQTADLQLIVAPREFLVSSMFGYTYIPYPRSFSLILHRGVLEPWWGAWRIFFPFAVAAGAFCAFMISWPLLALAYFLPVRFAGFYLDRSFKVGGAYKLSLAALMAPATFMGLALLLYAEHDVTLAGLAIAFVTHFILQWIYLAGGVFAAPRISRRKKNPFKPVEKEPKKINPFGGEEDEDEAIQTDSTEEKS